MARQAANRSPRMASPQREECETGQSSASTEANQVSICKAWGAALCARSTSGLSGEYSANGMDGEVMDDRYMMKGGTRARS